MRALRLGLAGGLALALALAGGSRSAEAQGPPIHTDTPIMLGLEGRGVRSFVKLRRARLIDEDASEEVVVTQIEAPVVVPYNLFSERVQVGIVAPFASIDSRAGGATASSSGLSDVVLFGKFLLYQRDGLNETFRVATKAGVQLGTGNERASPPLGRGSTHYLATVVAGWVRGRTGLYGEGIFNLNTSNDTVDFGNRFAYNVALGYRIAPAVYGTYPARQLNLFVELNGALTARSRSGGVALENTGGAQVLLSPGVQYVGGRRWLVEGSVQLPIVRRPNGRQLETSWTTLAGIRVLLF